MAVLLSCTDLNKSYGHRQLFENITMGVNDGEKLGLIGPNGAGKSTLFKILAGLEDPDSGVRSLKRGLRLGYLAQEEIFESGLNAGEILLHALADTEEHLDEHERENRIDIVLGKIGFSTTHRNAHVETLSGGWRKRLAIARELVRNPDLLLMDEPTNHLDLEGILWLEKLLRNAPFGYLLISHDRYFLENVTNRTMELNSCYPEGFLSISGKYSDFLIKREEFLSGQLQTQKALEGKVKREIEWLRRGPPARTTKSRSRIDSAGKMIDELSEVRARNNTQGNAVRIDFTSSDRQANKLLVLKNAGKSYGGRRVIGGVNLILSPGMKLGLLGGNGSGKTTLLRMMTGDLQPDEGTVVPAEKLRVVCFDQNREQLDKEATLRRALAPTGDTVSFRGQSTHVSAWSKRFLFRNEQLDMPVKSLSGGEQARILIARLMLRPADLLLLDEPTNDLDIPSLEVLESSLEDFPGAIVLVTHDRYLLQRLCSDILGLDGKGNASLFSDYSQWENAQRAAAKADSKSSASKSDSSRPATPAAPEAKSSKSAKLSYKEQREFDQMEAAILEKETAVEEINKQLEDPAVASDTKRSTGLYTALAAAQSAIETLYTRWAELAEKQK